jgi:hypothetical protein
VNFTWSANDRLCLASVSNYAKHSTRLLSTSQRFRARNQPRNLFWPLAEVADGPALELSGLEGSEKEDVGPDAPRAIIVGWTASESTLVMDPGFLDSFQSILRFLVLSIERVGRGA